MKETQESVHEWTTETFPQYATQKNRLTALIEEVAELAIANGLSISEVMNPIYLPYNKLARNRDVGTAKEELGDVLLCVLSYAEEASLNAQQCLEDKMRHNREKPKEFFDVKHKQKLELGLKLPITVHCVKPSNLNSPTSSADGTSGIHPTFAANYQRKIYTEEPLAGNPNYFKEITDRMKESAKTVDKISIAEVREHLKTAGKRLLRRRYSEDTMRDYLQMIEPKELADKYVKFYDDHSYFQKVCAGAKHHHWWEGGLDDHCSEMCGMGMDMMDLYPGDFTFTRSDLVVSVFLHDFAKVWTYRLITPEDREKNPTKFKEKQVFTYAEGAGRILDDESKTLLELSRSGIAPTDQQWSAVLFAEGGFSAAMYDFAGRSNAGETVFSDNHLASFVSVLDHYTSQLLGRSIY